MSTASPNDPDLAEFLRRRDAESVRQAPQITTDPSQPSGQAGPRGTRESAYDQFTARHRRLSRSTEGVLLAVVAVALLAMLGLGTGNAALVGSALQILLGAATIRLGWAGFSERGLPWTSRSRLKGGAGKTVGAILITFGLFLVITALAVSIMRVA